MSAVTSILAGIAAKAAAPFAKKILGEKLGPAGGIVDDFIDVIAGKLGVEPADVGEIATEYPDETREAIEAAEGKAAALWATHVESQKLATELQLAEMGKEQTWTWAWRPAWMWFLGALWAWRLVIVPTVDASSGSDMASAIDLGTLGWLTTVFATFYMGGHTAKDLIGKWLAKSA